MVTFCQIHGVCRLSALTPRALHSYDEIQLRVPTGSPSGPRVRDRDYRGATGVGARADATTRAATTVARAACVRTEAPIPSIP